MSGYEFALFWLGWILAGGSPGPATLSIAGTSMDYGRKSGVIFSLGILTGSASLGLAAAMGMSAVMLANAWLFELIRYIGAAYLLYLALKSLRSALSPHKELARRSYGGKAWQIYSRGALIHLTNPKAILAWAAVYSVVLPIDAPITAVFQVFAYLFAGSILVFIGYAFLFSTAKVVDIYQKMRRGFEFSFALFFGAAGLKLLTARLV